MKFETAGKEKPGLMDANGTPQHNGSTAKMILGDYLVHYMRQFLTLEPGDLISTGTPSGVGLGLKTPMHLKGGDKVELGIDYSGRQESILYSGELSVSFSISPLSSIHKRSLIGITSSGGKGAETSQRSTEWHTVRQRVRITREWKHTCAHHSG